VIIQTWGSTPFFYFSTMKYLYIKELYVIPYLLFYLYTMRVGAEQAKRTRHEEWSDEPESLEEEIAHTLRNEVSELVRLGPSLIGDDLYIGDRSIRVYCNRPEEDIMRDLSKIEDERKLHNRYVTFENAESKLKSILRWQSATLRNLDVSSYIELADEFDFLRENARRAFELARERQVLEIDKTEKLIEKFRRLSEFTKTLLGPSTLIGAVVPSPPFHPHLDNPIDYLIRYGPVSLVDNSSYKRHRLIQWIYRSGVDMSVVLDRTSKKVSIPLRERVAFFMRTEAGFERMIHFIEGVYRRQDDVVTRLRDGPNPYTELAIDKFGDAGGYAQNALERALHIQRRYRRSTSRWISTLKRLQAVAETLRKGLETRSPTHRRSLTMGKIFVY
jgi:hypothetical protein